MPLARPVVAATRLAAQPSSTLSQCSVLGQLRLKHRFSQIPQSARSWVPFPQTQESPVPVDEIGSFPISASICFHTQACQERAHASMART